MKKISKKDIEKLTEEAVSIVSKNPLFGEWSIKIIDGDKAMHNQVVYTVATVRDEERFFKSLDAVSNFLAGCGVKSFHVQT